VVIRIIFVILGIFIRFSVSLPTWYFGLLYQVLQQLLSECVRKKLFRDSDDKIIAGVCSGIGNYFGINAWIPRILFLLPF